MTRRSKGSAISRRQIIKASGALASSLFMSNVATAQSDAKRGGTLRIAMPYNPASVDPITGRNAPDFNVLYAIFDALIDFDPATLELRPGLAKAWRFTDPRSLQLDLVEGVRFHDGTPFDAESVKFNLERSRSDPRSNVKGDVRTIDRVEVNNSASVTLKLTRANAGLPMILHKPRRLHGIARVGPGRAERRPYPCGDRPIQVRRVAGQCGFQVDTVRKLSQGQPSQS